MKVTNISLARSISDQLAKSYSDLVDLQSKIATGRRILKPSDDPVGTTKTMQIASNLSEFDAYKTNMTYSRSYVQTSLTALDQLLDILSRAQEIAVQQRGASASTQTRFSAAVEVQNAFEEILVLANTRLGGKYIFGGHDTLNAPFQTDGAYIADSGEFRVNIGPKADMKINLSGDEIFTTGNGGADIFGALKELKDALTANDGNAIGNSIDSIITSFDLVNVKISEMGAKLNRLQNSQLSTEKISNNLQLVLSDTLDLDIADAIVQMSAKQNIMNAALSTAGRILNLSLVNYL